MLKRTPRAIAILVLMLAAGCPPPQAPTPQEARRRPAEAIRPPSDDEHNVFGYPARGTLLRRIGYSAGHDGRLRVSLWVAYHLTREYVDGPSFVEREDIPWRADPDLPPSERAIDDDYRNSGYARGHMAMHSDMRGRNEQCERQAFYLSNAAPQRQSFNNSIWKRLEYQCKNWARSQREVWIVCGPVFADDPPARLAGRRADHVAVPTHFYKIVVRNGPRGIEALGFLFEHETGDASTSLASRLTTIDEIEARTGLDFLAALDDALEDSLEAEPHRELWP